MPVKNQTHTNKWADANTYSKDWITRSELLIKLFFDYEYDPTQSYTFAEHGCGVNAPVEKFCASYENITVKKFDIKQWDAQTTVLDLNKPNTTLPKSNVCFFSGVLEYMNDVESVLHQAMNASDFIVLSYVYLPIEAKKDDQAFLNEMNKRVMSTGWRNHLTLDDLTQILTRIGIISGINTYNDNQVLFLVRNFSTEPAPK